MDPIIKKMEEQDVARVAIALQDWGVFSRPRHAIEYVKSCFLTMRSLFILQGQWGKIIGVLACEVTVSDQGGYILEIDQLYFDKFSPIVSSTSAGAELMEVAYKTLESHFQDRGQEMSILLSEKFIQQGQES